MTLDRFRPLADRLLTPFVSGAVRLGLSPDAISVLAFGVAVLAGGAFYLAGETPLLYVVGAALVFCNGLLDLLDGAVAREQSVESAAGDLLDHVIDRYADIVVVVGLAGGIDAWGIGIAAVTGVLMTSYLGTQAQAVGLDRVYGGVLGRADRLTLVGVVGVVAPVLDVSVLSLGVVGWLLVLFAVVGHLTAIQRFYHALSALE